MISFFPNDAEAKRPMPMISGHGPGGGPGSGPSRGFEGFGGGAKDKKDDKMTKADKTKKDDNKKGKDGKNAGKGNVGGKKKVTKEDARKPLKGKDGRK